MFKWFVCVKLGSQPGIWVRAYGPARSEARERIRAEWAHLEPKWVGCLSEGEYCRA